MSFVESIIHEAHFTPPGRAARPMPLSNTPTSPAIAWADPVRERAFNTWLHAVGGACGLVPASLRSASSDASFRRYFRIDGHGGQSFIVMDAPPPQEDVRPFIRVAGMLHGAGLNAPCVLAHDDALGFLLLTDLGAELCLDALLDAQARGDAASADALMRDAIRALVQWQSRADASALPPYDDALLRRELALFPQWCVTRELGVTWGTTDQAQWAATCDLLVRSALEQPTVAVHRDFMPRNLMVCRDVTGAVDRTGPSGNRANTANLSILANPGILDFQDAVRGPVSYDLASLLRDAFISWEEEQEIDWAVRYWQAARKAGLPLSDDFGAFWRQMEWMGLQRHLKVLGIFCRLKHRDAKPKYSEDLPRFFNYAHKVAARYNALRPFSRMLEPLMGATRVEGFY